MSVDNWDEIRTAYEVARLGTVSAAAEVLGVHHATVIRHIDALEGRMGIKLFQRHARGYTATEAGEDLKNIAATTSDQFSQLEGRLKGRGSAVTGDLVVTTVSGLSTLLTPVLTAFKLEHPELTIRFLTDQRLFRLDYGEAHVAIRAGQRPEDPDNVVQPFIALRARLCAAQNYIDKFGMPKDVSDLANHHIVAGDSANARGPFNKWLHENVPVEAITYRASEQVATEAAVAAGAGIGFVADTNIANFSGLVEVLEWQKEWCAPLWLVTHVDLHRTTKVQSFLKFLKEESNKW